MNRIAGLRTLINFIAFQCGWFACVYGAARGHAWLGAAGVAAVFALHLAMSRDRTGETVLALVSAGVGCVLELCLVNGGVADYASPSPIARLPPGWIIAMWVLLSTALNVSLRWMHGRLMIAALFGAIGAPLSYYAGARIGGMTIGVPVWRSFAVMAALWAVAMPVLIVVAARIARRKPGVTVA